MKKKNILLAIVVIVCICVMIFEAMNSKKEENRVDQNDSTEVGKDASAGDENQTQEEKMAETGKNTTETEKTTEELEKKEDTSTQTTKKDNTTDKNSTKSLFPMEIPNQDIVIQSCSGYDGIFVEDGSDETVKKVTTLLVKNKSEKAVEYGTITLRADDETLEFSFSALPAGKSCIVMEKNKTSYDKKWNLEYVESDFAFIDELSKLKSEVTVKKAENNGLTIKNKTGETIPRIRIFYKYQLDSGEYVGGITYTCSIDDLEKGETRTIYPSHFSSEGSTVMMVRRYEEKVD